MKLKKLSVIICLTGFFLSSLSLSSFACSARLDTEKTPNFVYRGVLGNPESYKQNVYSGPNSSFSTIVYHSSEMPDVRVLIRQVSEQMISASVKRFGHRNSSVKILNQEVLPKLDKRLLFLTYLSNENGRGITVEAASAIRNGKCWSLLRYTKIDAVSKNGALDEFGALINNTKLGG